MCSVHLGIFLSTLEGYDDSCVCVCVCGGGGGGGGYNEHIGFVSVFLEILDDLYTLTVVY